MIDDNDNDNDNDDNHDYREGGLSLQSSVLRRHQHLQEQYTFYTPDGHFISIFGFCPKSINPLNHATRPRRRLQTSREKKKKIISLLRNNNIASS